MEEIVEFGLAEESETAKFITGCAFSPVGDYMAASTDAGFIKVRLFFVCDLWQCSTPRFPQSDG